MALDIGKRIAELRRDRGINQEQLAELAMLSRVTIAKYESGRVEPGAQALSRIADALDVTTDMILGRTEETPDGQPRTVEARILAEGVDQMSKEQREQALNIMRAVYADMFKKGEDNDAEL